MSDKELRNVIERYIAEEISVAEFSQQFAGLYFAVRQSADLLPSAERLCDQVIGPFAEYSLGHRSEESLRTLLGRLVSVDRPQAHGALYVLSWNEVDDVHPSGEAQVSARSAAAYVSVAGSPLWYSASITRLLPSPGLQQL